MTNAEYLKLHHPHVQPCKKCKYWRTNGNPFHAMCEYLLITGEKRGCTPDHINGTCEKFQKR